jgi:hypothetical protein
MIKLPKGVSLSEAKFFLYQEGDCVGNGDYQDLAIEYYESGGGFFPVIRTERWAFDLDELDDYNLMFKDLANLVNNMSGDKDAVDRSED